MSKTGADISHHQPSFDAARYQAAGEDFLIHKATEGAGFVDDRFTSRWRACGQADLPRAAYHFARPGGSTVDAQADHFIGVLRAAGWRAGDGWALDLEDDGGLGPASLVAWSDRWCGRVRAALGGRGLFYTYPDFWHTTMGGPAQVPGGCLGWWARYRSTADAPAVFGDPPHFWQCTNGQVGCVKDVASIGRCDHNHATDAAFAALFGEDDVTETEFKTWLREEFTLVGGKTRGALKATALWGATEALAGSGLRDDEAKVLAAVAAVQTQVGASTDAVLAALAALDLELTDEQIAAIAVAVDVDEAAVAEAVRFRLADALAA